MSKKNNPCHNEQIPRLSRIAGQVEGIRKMIDDGRYCPDILMQLRAVRAALKTVEAGILETHLQSCVADAMNTESRAEVQEKINELKMLFKRYED